MKRYVKIGYIITSITFLYYLSIPNSVFPEKMSSSVQSYEPADVEDIKRRGYVTDLGRNEVMQFYFQQMQKEFILNTKVLTYRLNYPPEESQTIIRDQTRSTFLEEIVVPMRESLYINGFEPKQAQDYILVQDKLWKLKIIVKQIDSNVYLRVIVGLMCLLMIPIIYKNLTSVLSELRKDFLRLWIYR